MRRLLTISIPLLLVTALMIAGFDPAGIGGTAMGWSTQGAQGQHHPSEAEARSATGTQQVKPQQEMMSCMKDQEMHLRMMKNGMQDNDMRQGMMTMMTERKGDHSQMMRMHMQMMMGNKACQQIMVEVLRENSQMRQTTKEMLRQAGQSGTNL